MTQVKEVGPSAEQLGVGRIMSTADGLPEGFKPKGIHVAM